MSNTPETEDMLPEYHLDYSKAKPNRFAGRDRVTITLDEDVLDYFQARANAKGCKLSDLVNEVLKREIDLVEALK
jgi:uncharacterized protein (DUF4415 family)